MREKNKYDERGCQQMDKTATDLFLNCCKVRGWNTIKANKYEDIREHWDYRLEKNNTEYLVDVKSIKRVNSQSDIDDSLLLVELKNVNGNPGWLVGKADYIAFQVKEGFLLVKREKLYQLTRNLMDFNQEPVQSTKNKKRHIWYTRSQWGRNDKFAYLSKAEVLKITSTFWRIKNV